MKKIASIVLTITISLCMFFGVAEPAFAASKLTLEHSPMYVTIGGTITQHLLTASGKKVNGKKATWTVNNSKRVSVSKSGKVTGLTQGYTTVKAKYKGKTYKFRAYVKYAKKEFSEANLAVGETITQIIYAASGNKASISKIEFTTGNPSIATVDTEGKITAVSEGTVKIYAKYFGKKYIATINVLPKEEKEEENIKQETPQIVFGGGSGGSMPIESGQEDEPEEFNEPDEEGDSIDDSDEDSMKDTSYDEYKRMIKDGSLNQFKTEYRGKYGDKEYLNWLKKMKELEKEEETNNYLEVKGLDFGDV